MTHARAAAGIAAALAALALSGCGPGGARNAEFRHDAQGFPLPARPVASIVSDSWSTEAQRDRLNEAEAVMDKSGVKRGMTVADIGAGEGYYTVRLAARVGKKGRVLAEDIVPEVTEHLAERVARDRLDNVSVRLGDPANPKLPPNSFDRVMMVHMYHEIQDPFAFLWNLRPSLKPDGLVVVVDANRPTDRHGTPPAVLDCEFRNVGYVRVKHVAMPSAGGYMETFAVRGPRPAPDTIHPCDAAGRTI